MVLFLGSVDISAQTLRPAACPQDPWMPRINRGTSAFWDEMSTAPRKIRVSYSWVNLMYRSVKSYVLRTGRVSKRQQSALDHWLADYALDRKEAVWDLNAEYGRQADTIAEIGFGMGSSLFSMAQNQPEINFLGIEVHWAGVGSLVADLHDHMLSNVRVAAFDAVEVFEHCLADDALAGVQIFFPDPWPKKRHHKRRILNDAFIERLVKKIKRGGFIHCATDWQEYAEQMLECLAGNQNLLNQQPNGGFSPRPETRPLTKFEQRGTQLGHGVWDLIFKVR